MAELLIGGIIGFFIGVISCCIWTGLAIEPVHKGIVK
jgi:hypothetical protein